MTKRWFNINARGVTTAPAQVSIDDEIGSYGLTAKDFIAAWNDIDGDTVELSINSPGGSVFDAIAMFTAMRDSGKTINVRVLGIAASAASYLTLVGRNRSMPENAFMMVHDPSMALYGNAADFDEAAATLRKVGAILQSTYAARTGQTPEVIADLLSKDTYLTAAECLALGLVDEVTPALDMKASFDTAKLPTKVQALFGRASTQVASAPKVEAVIDPKPVDEKFDALTMRLAATAGLERFADVWAGRCQTKAEVRAAIGRATEFRAIADAARMQPGEFDAAIRAHLPSVDAMRIAVMNARADTDEETRVDGYAPMQAAASAGPSHASLWDAHRRSQKGAV